MKAYTKEHQIHWTSAGIRLLKFLNCVAILNYISMKLRCKSNTFIKSKKSTPTSPHSLLKSEYIKTKLRSLTIYNLVQFTLIFFLNRWDTFKARLPLVSVSKIQNAWMMWTDSQKLIASILNPKSKLREREKWRLKQKGRGKGNHVNYIAIKLTLILFCVNFLHCFVSKLKKSCLLLQRTV